jgi:gliding motility-associated protein GldC
MKESKITITVSLDDKNVPERISWEATDADFKGKKNSQTLILGLWDKDEAMTYSIDLWTKDLTVDDMNLHFHQLFLKMAETFERSTKNNEVGQMIRNFSSKFAEKLELNPDSRKS